MTCPLLLVVGQDDTNWAAVESADDVSNVPDSIECVLMQPILKMDLREWMYSP